MTRLIRIETPTQLEQFCSALSDLTLSQLQQQKADEYWVCVNSAGEIMSRCSLWWTTPPPRESQRLGVIGHFAAVDSASARELLTKACVVLQSHGCTMAVGPMDGNTWQRYRLVTERGTAPPFFLEPENPEAWPTYFAQTGFASMATYFSTITPDLSLRHERLPAMTAQWQARGVRIRSANRVGFTQELHSIFSVATVAFQNNFLYTPISEAAFVAQYEPLKPFLQPELVLLAEHEGRTVGFLFALPDALQARRGEAIDTFIIKTVAVLPEYAGLGSLLVARSHEVGAALGFRCAIHALMHETNKSRSISRHYAQPLRQYALFGRML